MVVFHEGKSVWLIVKPNSDGWLKVCETLDEAIEEYVVLYKVRQEHFVKIVKVTPNGGVDSSAKIVSVVQVDKERLWKRAFELHDTIKNRLVMEQSNVDKVGLT